MQPPVVVQNSQIEEVKKSSSIEDVIKKKVHLILTESGKKLSFSGLKDRNKAFDLINKQWQDSRPPLGPVIVETSINP